MGKKIIRLTESDLIRLVKRVIQEEETSLKLDCLESADFNNYTSKGEEVWEKEITKTVSGKKLNGMVRVKKSGPKIVAQYLDNSNPLPTLLKEFDGGGAWKTCQDVLKYVTNTYINSEY